jgi:tetratricopeptide (TPR) repeat protein
MRRIVVIAVLCAYAAGAASNRIEAAAETWSEIKTPNFIIWSNAGDRAARNVTWQFEQVRSATTALFPWAQAGLSKPVTVLVLKDERTMRAMAPKYWEGKGDVHPASVWVSGMDQIYLAIRADVRGEDNATLNPHRTAFFAYGNIAINGSFGYDVPLWFSRGLAGMIGNMIVRDDYVLLGAPIPDYLQTVRERRYSLKQLITMARSAPELQQGTELWRFDAQAWVLVHFLMFGDGGVYQPGLNRFVTALNAGKDPAAAFTEAIGPIDALQLKFAGYIDRNVYTAGKATLNADVKRERFAVREMSAAESAGGRAAFHVAMSRPAEARALIDEARAAEANAPAAHVAEGLQFDREGRSAEARAAFEKAVQAGSTNPWAYYRAAALKWNGGAAPDAETLKQMVSELTRATELQESFAAAYAMLAEVRAALNQSAGVIVPLLSKAIKLDPANPWHRLSAARTLWRLRSIEEARRMAEGALALSVTDAGARREAERLLATMPKQ